MARRHSSGITGREGLSLVELLVAVGLLSLVAFGTSTLIISSNRASSSIQDQSTVDSGVALAAERVVGYLKEARSISIDSNGMGVTYQNPAKKTDGSYTLDYQGMEATSHRIYVSQGSLWQSDASSRPILKSIPGTDPATGTTLRVFSYGLNSKQLAIRLVSQKSNSVRGPRYSAITIRIRPRNIM